MVIESNSSLMLADSIVGKCFKEVGFFINDNVMLDVGVLLIFKLEVVAGKLFNGKVGSANSSSMA